MSVFRFYRSRARYCHGKSSVCLCVRSPVYNVDVSLRLEFPAFSWVLSVWLAVRVVTVCPVRVINRSTSENRVAAGAENILYPAESWVPRGRAHQFFDRQTKCVTCCHQRTSLWKLPFDVLEFEAETRTEAKSQNRSVRAQAEDQKLSASLLKDEITSRADGLHLMEWVSVFKILLGSFKN